MFRRFSLALLAASAVTAWACRGDGVTSVPAGKGTLAVRLTDHPFPFDSVQAVNIFVVRIDARVAVADSAAADSACDDEHERMAEGFERHGEEDDFTWMTIARPATTFDLLQLRNGVRAFLGSAVVDTGQFRALRLVIDPARSSVVLKNGTVLTGTSSPGVKFPSGERAGIKIELDHEIHVTSRGQTTLVIDFDLEQSFEVRGASISLNGLLFKPVLRATHEED